MLPLFTFKTGSNSSGFRCKKRNYYFLKMYLVFRYTMVTARATPQTKGKPETVRRTLKTEYHSLGQNNETSVIRGPAIKKAGWPRGQWKRLVQIPAYRGVFQIHRALRTNRVEHLTKTPKPTTGILLNQGGGLFTYRIFTPTIRR